MALWQGRFADFKKKVWELLGEFGINGEDIGLQLECSSEFSELMNLAYNENMEEREMFRNNLIKMSKKQLNEQEIDNVFLGIEKIIVDKFIKMINEVDNELYSENRIEKECELLNNARNFRNKYKMLLSNENYINTKNELTYYEEEIKLTKLNEKIHQIPFLDYDAADKEIEELRKLIKETESFEMKHEYLDDNIQSWKEQFNQICQEHENKNVDYLSSIAVAKKQEEKTNCTYTIDELIK